MNQKIIGVIGAGYVGLVTAVCLASKGYIVFLHENNIQKFKLLEKGITPFFEPSLTEMYADVLNKYLFLKKNLEDLFDKKFIKMIFSCLPTPSDKDNSCNLSFVNNLFRQISKIKLTTEIILINESTIIPNSCVELDKLLMNSSLKITLIHSPEFLRQGSAIYDFNNPSRIIFGSKDALLEPDIKKELLEISSQFISIEKILFTDWTTAELIKYSANAYLASRITFINQIFRLATKLNVNMEELKNGIGLDPRIGTHYFQEGIGYGGSCLPKDIKALVVLGNKLNIDMNFFNEISNYNRSQLDWYFKEWTKKQGDLKNTKIIVKEISFKSGTSDTRESPKLNLIKKIATLKIGQLIICQKNIDTKPWLNLKKTGMMRKKNKINKTLNLDI